MKKLIVVMTLAVLGVMACKKKEEPAPEMKKYVYTRTPGEVTQIVGDIFVDTGGMVFTVKGKGFDPKRKKHYHLLLDWKYCTGGKRILDIAGYDLGTSPFGDSASLMSMTDSSLKFKVENKNVYSVRTYTGGNKDSLLISFAVTSKDSSSVNIISTHFDILKEKKVRNKLFFNILSDTLHWHTKSINRDTVITVEDVWADNNMVSIYFNGLELDSKDGYTSFGINESMTGDGYFYFTKYFYEQNKSLNLKDGFYEVTMKRTYTGLPIEEKHGKKGVYVKFVD